ncbi:hypothetical protein SAMN05216167_10522 [Spirosoma endophyticum]|uniref:Uncharacterized protein n=1 Tax=Spirosoma endophyticum TaxID=662367 RepID=A0A1I1SJJ3_9BACT|nr:hypothetical protein SAMN05216167_10522 [Spirosoma endophyticum]
MGQIAKPFVLSEADLTTLDQLVLSLPPFVSQF